VHAKSVIASIVGNYFAVDENIHTTLHYQFVICMAHDTFYSAI